MLDLDPSSAAGPVGIDNKQLVWMVVNDEKTGIVAALRAYILKVLKKGLIEPVRRALGMARGLPIAKEKGGEWDGDVRPVLILSSIQRAMDKCVCKLLVSKDDLVELTGPYQIMGEKGALEKAGVALPALMNIMRKSEGLAFLNLDAHNAFNCYYQQCLYDIYKEKHPILANWMVYLCESPICGIFDYEHKVYNRRGGPQGASSTLIGYNTIAWHADRKALDYCAEREINIKTREIRKIKKVSDEMELNQNEEEKSLNDNEMEESDDEVDLADITIETQRALRTNKSVEEGNIEWIKFNIEVLIQYVDDGLKGMQMIWIEAVLNRLIFEYQRFGITINASKSRIVINTQEGEVLAEAQRVAEKLDIKLETEGNIKYLGAAHGSDEFVNEYMLKKLRDLDKKLDHIEMLEDDFIKLNMVTKLYNFNKVNYFLRVQRVTMEWMDFLMKIQDRINNIVVGKLNFNQNLQYQIQLSSRRGGLGLRMPKQYEIAAKLSAFKGMESEIERFCLFSTNAVSMNMNGSENDEIFYSKKWNDLDEGKTRLLMFEKDLVRENYQKLIERFDEIVYPLKYVSTQHTSNKALIETYDKHLLCMIYSNGSIEDKARMKGLSNNGSQGWLKVPYNYYLGEVYNNTETRVLLSLDLGCEIVRKNQICKKCGIEMDKYGYHALSCAKGGGMVRRHEAIKHCLNNCLKKAGFETKMEEKYKQDENGNYEVTGVPGDIKIFDWKLNGSEEERSVWLDVTVGNIHSKSYINFTSKTRGYLMRKKENEKSKKYQNKTDIYGLAFETLGGTSSNVSMIVRNIAKRMEAKNNIPYAIQIGTIRSRLLGKMMKEQARMIIDCYDLN